MTKKIIIIGLISAVAVTGFYIYKRNKRTRRRRQQQQQVNNSIMEPAPRIDEIGVPILPPTVPPKFENLEITF
jgi:hypothetical protein